MEPILEPIPIPIMEPISEKPKTLMFVNIRGLVNSNSSYKMDLLKDLVSDRNCFLVCLTESHLNTYIPHTETDLIVWEQVRSDRDKIIGGGVVCYVRDTIPLTNSLIFSNSYCEVVCFNLPSINTVNITIYRPPGCPSEKFKESINVVSDWLKKQESGVSPIVILNGDFNLPFNGRLVRGEN